jgi:hypothetical protein
MGVLENPMPEANNKVPELVFAIYQSFFACLVPAIILGAAAERSRFLPAMVFTFWSARSIFPPRCLSPSVRKRNAQLSPFSHDTLHLFGLAGPPSSTTLSPTGSGPPTAGLSSGVSSTMPAASPSRSLPERPVSPTRTSSAIDRATADRRRSSSLTTSRMLSLGRSCFGLDGWASSKTFFSLLVHFGSCP